MNNLAQAMLGYDPAQLKPGVVHVGTGNFARAHLFNYLHDLAELGYKDWGVMGIKPTCRDDQEPSPDTGHLYTLIAQNGRIHRHILGPLLGVMGGQKSPAAVIERMASPETRLITLTITHSGYCLNASNMPDVEKLSADIVALKKQDWENVRTVPGWLVASLYLRQQRDLPYPTILSLDNLPRNGTITRNAIVRLAHEVSPELAQYAEKVACPHSVVDRIVPRTPADIYEHHVIVGTPIVSEEHRAFFIEDRFSPGTRPPLDEVGAKFVSDTRPYEEAKIGIVNGGHLALAVVAKIIGVQIVHEAIDTAKHPVLRSYLEKFLKQAEDALSVRLNVDVSQWHATTLERFGNDKLPDTVDRLLVSTCSKVVPRLFNAAALECGLPADGSAFAIAAWMNYMKTNGIEFLGEDITTNPIDTPEELVDFLTPGAKGVSPSVLRSFVDRVFDDYALIQEKGLAVALAERFITNPERSLVSGSGPLPVLAPT
ncbi:MAG: mannitol dehydrogenase family protein [Alphaproteobacteria bacterium]|nr:mannitol dehydrogenase family protein [Alphaproteobacteria bacterium]